MTYRAGPLRALAEVRLGRQRSPQYADGPHMVPYLRAANIRDGELLLDDIKFMNFSPEEQAVFGLRPGDVLVTEGAGSLTAVGASAVWDGSIEGPLCFQNTLLRLRPREPNDARFLGWWARAAHGSGQFAAIAGGANIFHLGAEAVRAMRAPIPSVEQQRRIADFLDAETARIDALIAAKERMMRIAKARYRSVVVGDTASLGPVKLKRLATLVDCKHRTPEYAPEGFPVVSPGDVTPGELDLSVCHRFVGRDDWSDLTDGPRRPRRGDIVYSRNASIGLAALVNTDEPFCMGQDVCLVPPLRHDADGRYLTHVLNTVGLDQIDQLKVGSTFFRVNVAQIADLEVPTASEGVQNEMVERWDRVLAWISGLTATLTRQIELLRERRQALITAAVTGELEV